MAKDDWMKMTKGGSRTSEYSPPENKGGNNAGYTYLEEKKAALKKFRREAAELKRRRIDSIAK